MPKFSVQKQKTIHAPKAKVHQLVGDMNHWPMWSPWLISEPEAKVEVSPEGNNYAWSGKRVGAGNMTITNKSSDEIQYDLNILKPWKASSKVKIFLKEVNDGTEVTWKMDGSLPFFMFFFKKMMTLLIGMDYERGLNLLKDYAEDGKVHSQLNFQGESYFNGCNYIGVIQNKVFIAANN